MQVKFSCFVRDVSKSTSTPPDRGVAGCLRHTALLHPRLDMKTVALEGLRVCSLFDERTVNRIN